MWLTFVQNRIGFKEFSPEILMWYCYKKGWPLPQFMTHLTLHCCSIFPYNIPFHKLHGNRPRYFNVHIHEMWLCILMGHGWRQNCYLPVMKLKPEWSGNGYILVIIKSSYNGEAICAMYGHVWNTRIYMKLYSEYVYIHNPRDPRPNQRQPETSSPVPPYH